MSDDRAGAPSPRAAIYAALAQLDAAEFWFVVGLLHASIGPLRRLAPVGGLLTLLQALDAYTTERGEHGRGSALEQVRTPARGDPA